MDTPRIQARASGFRLMFYGAGPFPSVSASPDDYTFGYWLVMLALAYAGLSITAANGG